MTQNQTNENPSIDGQNGQGEAAEQNTAQSPAQPVPTLQSQAQQRAIEAGLNRIRRWRDQYRGMLAPSPLEDVSQLTAKLDMTHAHPSGVAQLFASGHVMLDSLFRDSGVLKAAERHVARVLDDQSAKRRVSGVAELSLVVGVATWKGNALPVLLYPVDVTVPKDGVPSIRFSGRVGLNNAFVNALREQGVFLDEDALFDGSNYDSGTPETSAMFSRIATEADERIADFSIERQILLGCLMDPSSLMVSEARRTIDQLKAGPTGNTLLDALAGSESAQATLKAVDLPQYSPFDADPHTEYEVGDADNTVRYAASLAASGHSVVVDGAFSKGTAETAVAIASRCLMNGRSVLYVPGVAEQRRRFMQVAAANEMKAQLLDVADEHANTAIDQQLIAAVGFQPGVATQRFDQLADELVGVRSRLTRYLGDLHGVNEKWKVSAYETIQNLARISVLPTHPATHVRLKEQSALTVGENMESWIGKLERAGELGEFSIGPEDTAWYRASLTTEQDAVTAYQRVDDLLRKFLPATRDQVARTVQTCGFPVPVSSYEWGKQVTVLKNLRRVLDVFQPEIFERDIDAMIEATKPKAVRKAEGTSMGFWERRRHIKEAKGLLRVGAQVEDLHEALKVVAKQGEQWHEFVPHGGWPVLPTKLDEIISTQEALMTNMTALDAVLATTPSGGNLETDDFTKVEARLKTLLDDRKALDTLPERCCLEQDFAAAGLNELVADLTARHATVEQIRGEVQLAWWTTVFEDIVRSSAIISNQDGSVLQTASDRFAQVDVEHVRSVGPMVAQESMRRLCDMLFSRTQEANQLHTALAGRANVQLSRIRRNHPEILAAAKPILVASPGTLAALTEPEGLADVAILDACAHMPSIELLSVLARVRQVVIIAHCATTTSESVRQLIDMLPRVEVESEPSRRPPRLAAFLESEGYGSVRYDVTTEPAAGEVHFHRVEANGVPVMSTGLVESSQQEIDEVVRIITERAGRFTVVPASYRLAVVVLTDAFRTRLGAELKSLASKSEAMNRFLRHVRLVNLRDVAGSQATDVIISLCYAKTVHGRLLQQFGVLESEGGRGMLLDALALADHDLDIVSAFGPEEMEDERLHQPGPKFLKTMLTWAGQLDGRPVLPVKNAATENMLFADIADRLRARGLETALEYGFDKGIKIPLVVGVKDKPFALAVQTDDANFMSVQSTRRRHRLSAQDLISLGWNVMTVWSVAAFVNPDKEVDRIVARISEIYGEVK
ncbi:helicase [Bifidobacterium miconisargentati]|uniref:helicase n=1 Tax=Bifidobacterium miconisargentati TaxID=2834437 RepID=UPI001BDCA21A|nr:helicase [Bifidobacterium miconisargentati]MBW3090845.1 helicase [Bifidobacterium miconisargentati]